MKTKYNMEIIWDQNNVTIDASESKDGDDLPSAMKSLITHYIMTLETTLRTLAQNANMSKLMKGKTYEG